MNPKQAALVYLALKALQQLDRSWRNLSSLGLAPSLAGYLVKSLILSGRLHVWTPDGAREFRVSGDWEHKIEKELLDRGIAGVVDWEFRAVSLNVDGELLQMAAQARPLAEFEAEGLGTVRMPASQIAASFVLSAAALIEEASQDGETAAVEIEPITPTIPSVRKLVTIRPRLSLDLEAARERLHSDGETAWESIESFRAALTLLAAAEDAPEHRAAADQLDRDWPLPALAQVIDKSPALDPAALHVALPPNDASATCNASHETSRQTPPELSSTDREIAQWICENPGKTIEEVAAATGLERSSFARHNWPRLQKHGFYNEAPHGKPGRLMPPKTI